MPNVGEIQNQQTHQLQSQSYNQGQSHGHFTQQQATQYNQSAMNVSDNGALIEMVQQMNINFMTRLTAIEQIKSKLSTIEIEMQFVRSGVYKLQTDNTQITTRLTEVEKSCQNISNMFDNNMIVSEKVNRETVHLKHENENLKSEAAKFDKKCETFQNEISELKARSMQQNLVCFGIAEAPVGEPDKPESKLRDFLKNELTFDDPNFIDTVVFDRVHTLGWPKRFRAAKPRLIVTRFERYKDREAIRLASKD